MFRRYVAFACLAGLATAAQAQIIYENDVKFGAGTTNDAWSMVFEVADDLTLASNAPIGTVSVNTWSLDPESYSMTARIYERNGISAPNTLLATRTGSFTNATGGDSVATFDFNGLTHASNEIWLSLECFVDDQSYYSIGGQPTTGSSTNSFYWKLNGFWERVDGPSTPQYNMAVTVRGVPEPATLSVLLVGAAAVLRRRKTVAV